MSPSFSFQKQINNNAILPLRRGKERDETWMATPSFTKIKNKKNWLSWHEWKIPMALKSKYLPLSCPSWAHVRYPPTTWRRCWHLVMQTARELKWGHWQCHLAGNRGHSWDIRPGIFSQMWRPGFAPQCYTEHKTHLPSNITVCILIFPGKYWQLYYPTNINCAFVPVSVQPVHWKCVLASVQIHFSAPKEIFIVIKACWDCFQFIHNCF